ncbi:MAG: hypothetical protein KKA79_03190, partial [Nanoarchaeota archaeon]|nr:hypothetical protein [Nanoarchaeota archaeon]
ATQEMIDKYQFKESGFNLEGKVSYFLYGLEGTTYQCFVDNKDYLYYKAQNKGLRGGEEKDFNAYLKEVADKVDHKSKYMQHVRDEVVYKIADPNNKLEVAQKILDLVHRIPYIKDYGHDYVKHHTETLVEGGDCDDLATLYASLAKACDIDTILVHFKNHIVAAVNLPLDEGTYIELDDKRYYLVETTGTEYPSQPADFKIGEVGANLKDDALVLGILDLNTNNIVNEEKDNIKDKLDLIQNKEDNNGNTGPKTDEGENISEEDLSGIVEDERDWKAEGYGDITFDVYPEKRTGKNLDIWVSASDWKEEIDVKKLRLYVDGNLAKEKDGLPDNIGESFWANFKNNEPRTHEYLIEYIYEDGAIRRISKKVEFTGGVVDEPPITPKITVYRCDQLSVGAWDHGDNKGIDHVFIYKNGQIWNDIKIDHDKSLKENLSFFVQMDDTTGPDEYYVQFLDKGGNVTTSKTLIFDQDLSHCYDYKEGSEESRIKNFVDIEPESIDGKILEPGTYKIDGNEKTSVKPIVLDDEASSSKSFTKEDYNAEYRNMQKEAGEYNDAYKVYIDLITENNQDKLKVAEAEAKYKKEYGEFTASIEKLKLIFNELKENLEKD